jgi:hypothetical protein
MGERLKDAAGEATDALKESAERRGMTAEGLKEMAGEVGSAFSSRMSEGSAGSGQASPGSSAGGGQPGRSSQASQVSGAGAAQPGQGNQASKGSSAEIKRTPLD